MNRQQRSPSFLLVCPKNLKECIDWVLRATGKDNLKGTDNIENLKNALQAELKVSGLNDLTQLVQGLCLFLGYPSCLCKPKKSVEESLRRISGELKGELKNYECLSKPSLNCDSCKSFPVVCKCCVLDCINEVQTSCGCVQGSRNDCDCSKGEPKRCCKDLLEKLKASLSLLNLKTDMAEICKCTDVNCCDKGECTGGSSKCPFCINLQASKDYTVTGLGLLRPSPKRLAQRLDKIFGNGPGPKNFCSCQCGSKPKESCCCLACPGECSQACSCKGSSGQCPCTKKPSPCPRLTFCQNINSIKVASGSGHMTCCNKGNECHCSLGLTSGSQCSGSPNCCTAKKSLKCMIRRLVSYFKDLDSHSGKFFKSCCDLLCVIKTCEFLKGFLSKGAAKECGTCKEGKGVKCNGSKGDCCGGSSPKCSSSGTLCKDCDECQQICDAKKFYRELSQLQYSSPCGQDLYRLIDDFLHCCGALHGILKAYEERIKKAQEKCGSQCCPKTPSGQPCPCYSKTGSYSDCKACKALHGDNALKTFLLSEFSSSYSSNAKWDRLCSPGSPCSGCRDSSPYCPCKSAFPLEFSSCLSDPCCDYCDVKKAAKIFLGMLPCLYYGLKFLKEKCEVDWKDLYISNKDHSLGRFLVGMGYEIEKLENKKGSDIFGPLSSLFTSSNGSEFKKLYDFVSKNYLPSPSHSRSLVSTSSSQPKTPETVREILLWLSGLPFIPGFKDLLNHCKGLCDSTQGSVNFDKFKASLFDSCFLSPFVLAAIQWPGKSEIFPLNFSEISKSLYPEDPFDLLDMLFEYLRKVFPALKFLSIQCKNGSAQAGWKDCAFGQGCVKGLKDSLDSLSTPASPSSCCSDSGPYGILCTSKPNESNVHEHCTKPGVKCIGLGPCTDTAEESSKKTAKDAHSQGKCTASCPHPLLMFLIDGSLGSDPGKSYSLFKLPEDSFVPKMGFSENLPSPGRRGQDLSPVLNSFCGSSSLTSLLRSLVCISRTPPESLGELFGFFKKFKGSSVLHSKLLSWIKDEPGFYNGQNFTNALKDALETLKGSSHSSSHSGSHPFDLYSLIDCHVPQGAGEDATCGAYLYSLTGDVYDIFIDSPGMYLSWICYLPKDFKNRLEEFKQKFSDCCQSSSCKKIVECPCALATLYSQGFVYYSPNSLACWNNAVSTQHGNGTHKEGDQNCTMKSCSDFIEQLGKVAQGSPLQALLDAIDKFLWHIRLPFFLFILAFWAFVISYFLYVQLYKLDLLHLKSHAHFSRSFKILPSTLFSDASSRLKDLSYFTL